jgi:hypothetical protein
MPRFHAGMRYAERLKVVVTIVVTVVPTIVVIGEKEPEEVGFREIRRL